MSCFFDSQCRHTNRNRISETNGQYQSWSRLEVFFCATIPTVHAEDDQFLTLQWAVSH